MEIVTAIKNFIDHHISSIYLTKYVRKYKEYHSVCPSSELGLPPTPHPKASVPPPPCFWGEGNTRWRERGWESPNSDEGHTLWYSLYVRTLWSTYRVHSHAPSIRSHRGIRWFDQISSQWESQKNRFAFISFGKNQFLPPFIWNLPFMSTASGCRIPSVLDGRTVSPI